MKYLQINSDFIDREFNKILQNALQGIKHNVSDSRSKGEMDCIMSTFGKQLDEFTENYVIDHIKVSRKFNHKDEVTRDVLRVLNTYKKVGIHKMFEKLYPKAFIKRQVRRAPLSDLSTGDIKNTIAGLLNNLVTSRSASLNKQATSSRVLSYLEEVGIRNISHYFNGELMDLIGNSNALRNLFIKANGTYENIINEIRRGDFDLGDPYDMSNSEIPENIKFDSTIMEQLKKIDEQQSSTGTYMPYFTFSGSAVSSTPIEVAPPKEDSIKPGFRHVNIQPIPVQRVNKVIYKNTK